MTPLDSSHIEVFLGFFWEIFHFLNSNLNFELGPVSYRTKPEPVRAGSGSGRFQTSPNSKFKLKFRKMKNSQKIPKNISRYDESNGVKFSQIFDHLLWFAEFRS